MTQLDSRNHRMPHLLPDDAKEAYEERLAIILEQPRKDDFSDEFDRVWQAKDIAWKQAAPEEK
jgi:hypothetical protein